MVHFGTEAAFLVHEAARWVCSSGKTVAHHGRKQDVTDSALGGWVEHDSQARALCMPAADLARRAQPIAWGREDRGSEQPQEPISDHLTPRPRG